MTSPGLACPHLRAPFLLGVLVLAGAVLLAVFSSRVGTSEITAAVLWIVAAAFLIVVGACYVVALTVIIIFMTLAMVLPLVACVVLLKALAERAAETLAQVLADAHENARVAYRGVRHRTASGRWVRVATAFLPPELAEGFVNDVCHHRDELARTGARPIAIELATAVIYAQALLGWICNLVLRVVTVPFPRPKD